MFLFSGSGLYLSASLQLCFTMVNELHFSIQLHQSANTIQKYKIYKFEYFDDVLAFFVLFFSIRNI